MRALVPEYDIVVPRTLREALRMLAGEPSLVPLAGGTDLMVAFEASRLEPRRLIGLWQLDELRAIRASRNELAIGALATYTALRRHRVVQAEFPLLAQAARLTGAAAIQNRGTLGGNLANASPAADSPPALLVYDAELELVSARGARRIPYADFHLGYKKTALGAGELIRSIHLPRGARESTSVYRKVGTRSAQAISKVCFAGLLRGTREIEDIRLAFGSVAPVPLRAAATESMLRGKRPSRELVREARAVLAREIAPIDDLRSTRDYRLAVAQNLMEEFLCDGLGLDYDA